MRGIDTELGLRRPSIHRDGCSIKAVIVGAAAAVAAAKDGAVAGSLGVSLARNLIGWNVNDNNSVVPDRAEVQAYVRDSSIYANGALALEATAAQTIDALVLAMSVGVAPASEPPPEP